ncbi:MAG: hypothetical protein TYPL_1790 [Candidatus Tyloplasma litorale]|nr:MAG: hypothetical protein TYPL_1790 [Mycoplasmatales bacterium]
MNKVFISFYNKDIWYKDKLLEINEEYNIFIDKSVDPYDIKDEDNLTDEQIRVKIRDRYLRNSSITIVLVGRETKNRKHVDWEIGSSVIDGPKNKKSGIIVIYLPELHWTNKISTISPSINVKKEINKTRETNWVNWNKKNIFNEHPFLPERILRNIKNNEIEICILQWNDIISNTNILREAIKWTSIHKDEQKWDTSIPFMRRNKEN